MTTYNFAQLEGLWIKAGGPADKAPLAAAIALAESSGNSAAMNYTDNGGTQTSVGLWQVSSGTHSYPQSWTTPEGNAAEAVAKYKGAGGFSPWGTYSSGAYKRFLGSATPDTNVPGGGKASGGATAGGAAPSAPPPTALAENCLVGIPSFGVGPFNTPNICLFEKSWLRAILGGALFLAGGVVTGVGVVQLLKVMGAGSLIPAPARKAPEVQPPAAVTPPAQPAPVPRPEPVKQVPQRPTGRKPSTKPPLFSLGEAMEAAIAA